MVVAVSGDVKPWNVAQGAAGEPADRLRNYQHATTCWSHQSGSSLEPRCVGGVPVVPQRASVSVPSSPLVNNHPAYPGYRKREAEPEPYTLAQVAAGQTAGGVITSVGGVPVVPHRAPVSVYNVPHTPLVYNHPVYYSNFLG